ncbi:hypothetical protein HPB48_002101 [Haemaphysalis longicornis]|uniref:Uncharacterized protein n=1 Tax=Haemaphysalis longicornis TaxID=44386 RepID=A0A9J6FGT0_HAELO|nr:hypothetical protein HPB48_002101 [Haemaphysalis longicornis]
MELRKWTFNISALRDLFVRDKLKFENEGSDATTMKVLGASWNRTEDTRLASTENVAAFINTMPTTKRTLPQAFARIYDPLGFLAPFTVRANIIFQDLWKLRYPWDSSLPPSVAEPGVSSGLPERSISLSASVDVLLLCVMKMQPQAILTELWQGRDLAGFGRHARKRTEEI